MPVADNVSIFDLVEQDHHLELSDQQVRRADLVLRRFPAWPNRSEYETKYAFGYEDAFCAISEFCTDLAETNRFRLGDDRPYQYEIVSRYYVVLIADDVGAVPTGEWDVEVPCEDGVHVARGTIDCVPKALVAHDVLGRSGLGTMLRVTAE